MGASSGWRGCGVELKKRERNLQESQDPQFKERDGSQKTIKKKSEGKKREGADPK